MKKKFRLWLYWESSESDQHILPEYIKLCFETVKKHCSRDFEVTMVTPQNLHDYLPDLRGDLGEIRRIGQLNKTCIPIKAAYIRVALLKKYGGVWLDTDMVVIKSFSEVKDKLEIYDFVGYRHWFGHVVNNFLASNKEGDVISEYYKNLNDLLDETKILEWGQAGARTITPIVETSSNVYLFERKSFHPIHYKDKKKFFKKKLIVDDFIDDSTLCFALFNQVFPESFKVKSQKDILSEDTLISKVFKYALSVEVVT